jgi:hypothetical protein
MHNLNEETRGTQEQETTLMYYYGHLHHVILEQRDHGSFLTLECGTDYREVCEKIRFEQGPPMIIHQIRTAIAATPAIVTAFNQGDATYLRADTAARTARLALLDFLVSHQDEDPYCGIVESDLRRHAAIPLCGE